MNKIISLIVFTVTISGLMFPVYAETVLQDAAAAQNLSADESADLQFMREEEKLARDVYKTLHNRWESRVFNNISRSEQKHMDSILNLLGKYNIPDPALDSAHFSNPELQKLFDVLVTDGNRSLSHALKVGALIEEVDIQDITDAMKRTDKADILAVYSSLIAGSKNHLRAFVRNIEKITGEPYTAQRLAQQEVDAILGR